MGMGHLVMLPLGLSVLTDFFCHPKNLMISTKYPPPPPPINNDRSQVSFQSIVTKLAKMTQIN